MSWLMHKLLIPSSWLCSLRTDENRLLTHVTVNIGIGFWCLKVMKLIIILLLETKSPFIIRYKLIFSPYQIWIRYETFSTDSEHFTKTHGSHCQVRDQSEKSSGEINPFVNFGSPFNRMLPWFWILIIAELFDVITHVLIRESEGKDIEDSRLFFNSVHAKVRFSLAGHRNCNREVTYLHHRSPITFWESTSAYSNATRIFAIQVMTPLMTVAAASYIFARWPGNRLYTAQSQSVTAGQPGLYTNISFIVMNSVVQNLLSLGLNYCWLIFTVLNSSRKYESASYSLQTLFNVSLIQIFQQLRATLTLPNGDIRQK